MNTTATRDRLFSSLNPLVMDGTLTPGQADAVYRAVGNDQSAARPDQGTQGWDRPRLVAAVTVLAAGLLATAYVTAAVVDEGKGLGWKSTVLLLAVIAVVSTAAAVWFTLLKRQAWSSWLSGVLGALALAALSFALLILWDPDALVYVAGLLMLSGGAAGFWFLRGQLFAVVAVVGGVLVLGQIFSDTLSSSADEGDALTIGIAFLFYGLVVTAAGWLLPCRRLLGVIGLGIGGVAMFTVMVVNAAAVAFAMAFSDPQFSGPDVGGPSVGSIRSDIRVALILGLVVVVLAALAHAYDGYVGFAILAFIGAAVLPVTAIFALNSEHPLRWGAAYAVIASLGLAAIVWLQFQRRTPPAQHGYAGSPMPPGQTHDGRSDTVAW